MTMQTVFEEAIQTRTIRISCAKTGNCLEQLSKQRLGWCRKRRLSLVHPLSRLWWSVEGS